MKTSLGIWAFGSIATRFNPGGYKPDLSGASTADKVRTAVEGLGDLMDDYEFHYPQELNRDNLDDVRAALDGHVRDAAVQEALEAADLAGDVGAQMILWPGVEGYNYPFQTPYADSWARFLDGVGQVAARCAENGTTLFLEHKNSEPAMKILMRNVGMTLHVIHTLRSEAVTNVKVNMDWQHLLMNGE